MVLRPACRHRWLAALLLAAGGAVAVAQPVRLSVDEIYSYDGWRRFNGSAAASLGWAPDGDPWIDDASFLWPADAAREPQAGSWLRVEALSGAGQPLFTFAALEAALREAGVPAAEARTASRQRPSIFNARRDAFLLAIDDDLYAFDIGAARAARLTRSPGAKSDATFSPDGRLVAYIKGHNLWVTAVGAPNERQLTADGHRDLLNGALDWVYEEELYGRGHSRAYWWSPDSSRVAFLQLDERGVPDYTLVDDLPYHPVVRRWKYPKAGDPNPAVRLGIVRADGGGVRWADTAASSDVLVVSVGWSPDSSGVVFQVQNREQTWLDLNRADATTGAVTRLVREMAGAWVERWQNTNVDPIWLKDGSFLWLSERSGWRHLYHYSAAGALLRQVTDGEWEVRQTHGTDRDGRWIYFSSTEAGPTGFDAYRARLDGQGRQRLSARAGRHQVYFNPSRTLWLDSWSDVHTPPQVRLHGSDGGELRVVDANPVPALDALPRPELLQVTAGDGFVMEALMIRPPAFDPAKRYPVYQFVYGGPRLPQVVNGWSGVEFLYLHLLAQQGIIVWICDNRSSSGKGAQAIWPIHGRLGALELGDIEDGLAWLGRQPYVDGSRIGIAGASYGGFLTLYALTHSRRFVMGIAESAVSDWRSYDSIYAERLLGLPDRNPDGYRRSSPRFQAGALHGNLLLVHGGLDDNVHPQHASQMAYELQRAGKPFQLMIYPRSAHGVSDPDAVTHLRHLMLDFTVQNLLR